MPGIKEYLSKRQDEYEESDKEDNNVEEENCDLEEDPKDSWRFKMQQLRERKDCGRICRKDGGYAWNECEENSGTKDGESQKSVEQESDDEEPKSQAVRVYLCGEMLLMPS